MRKETKDPRRNRYGWRGGGVRMTYLSSVSWHQAGPWTYWMRCTSPMFPLSRGLTTSLLFTSICFCFKMDTWAWIGPGTLGINLFDFNFSNKCYGYWIGVELPLWDSNTTWQLIICRHLTGFYKCKSTAAIGLYLDGKKISHLFLVLKKWLLFCY